MPIFLQYKQSYSTIKSTSFNWQDCVDVIKIYLKSMSSFTLESALISVYKALLMHNQDFTQYLTKMELNQVSSALYSSNLNVAFIWEHVCKSIKHHASLYLISSALQHWINQIKSMKAHTGLNHGITIIHVLCYQERTTDMSLTLQDLSLDLLLSFMTSNVTYVQVWDHIILSLISNDGCNFIIQ